LHLTAVSAPRLPVVEIPVLNHWATGSDAAQHAATVPRHPVVEIPRLRHLADVSEVERQRKITAIKAGDVLSVIKDGESSVWRDVVSRWTAADNCWYIYVQAVDLSNSGKRSFVGIWLYKPCDTSCAKMKYPYPNELFFSEHCTCGHTIKEDEVIDIVTVEWSGEPPASEIFFIRQTYLTNDIFITLKEAHKQWKHQVAKQATPPNKRRWFPIGVTVLVCPSDLIPPHRKSKYGLEPCEIDDYENSGSKQYAVLRRLLRRQEIDKQKISRPNELVYSNETVRLESSKIERTCLVRFYSESTAENGRIPAPYNLDGAGNAFYITSKLKSGSRKLTPILPNDFPKSLIQGFNPEESLHRKLRSLDLYCGGGNFGRGLEEAGAIENEWAVDMDRNAIHTYYANLQRPGSVKLFYGSVNDQLYQALQGNPKNSALIPRPGEVEFISAGSPCQGFSKLNSKNRNKEMGLKNQSMVASVAAYVDFYRPRYGLLENVLDMATKGDEDVLSQLKCTIAGMGYQLSTFTLDAWSFGSPQSRSRIFVAFTAPDCKPIPHPELSHSHPSSVRSRGLGTLANGESFGERRHDPTPFRFLNARDAVRDLPDIGDGATYSCVRYPDHVLHIELKEEMRQQIAAIPRYPRGMNFWKAWDDGNGDMSKEERALFPDEINREGNPSQSVGKNSKAWGRVHPRHLFSTMVVKSGLRDARTGTIIHWDENRPTNVMEARRAQSFRDEDVILGNALERMKIIGNSVDRSVALALGLSVREVWEENSNDDLLRNKHRGFSESTGSKMSRPINSMSRTNSKALPNRVLRNSYDSDDQDLLEQNRLLSPDPLALPISIARRPKTFQPIKRPSLDRKSSKEALKRPNVLLAPYNVRTDKSFKAAKLSAGSSPSGCDLEEASPSLATMTSKKNNLSRLREQPVNARHLSQTLQVVTQDFEREFMGRSSSVEGETNDRVEIPMLPVLSRQGRRFTQKTRIKATSNRGNGSSSASLIPKPQVVIDLTADSEGSNGTDLAGFSHSDMGEDSDDLQVKYKMLPTLSNGLVSTKHDVANASTRGKGRAPVKCTPASQIVIDLISGDESETESMPPATLPGRPAVVTSPSKYVPTRNPYSAYAKTYQARCMNQLRRHGPKR
jgi:DNA (cytosine-5)-methyltransferase 1